VLDRIDLTDVRASLRRAWTDNRLVAATAGAGLLAILALVVSAGAFGAPEAAAGLPPAIGESVESFTPGQSTEPAASDLPGSSDAPSAEPGTASPEPSGEPSPTAS
jgi:hypothetical protein